MAAARQVFERKGFAEATLDDVVALSGGSRQTLYTLFGGKQGLFEAITSDTCETIFQGLTPEKLATRATDEVLKEVGTRYLAIVTSPSCLSLNRLVIAEMPRIPEVAQRFWKLGPGRSRAFLAEFFDRQIERGLLRMQNRRGVFPRYAVRNRAAAMLSLVCANRQRRRKSKRSSKMPLLTS